MVRSGGRGGLSDSLGFRHSLAPLPPLRNSALDHFRPPQRLAEKGQRSSLLLEAELGGERLAETDLGLFAASKEGFGEAETEFQERHVLHVSRS